MFLDAKSFVVYWLRAWGSVLTGLVKVLGIVGVFWSLVSPLTEYVRGRIQKQTHREAWLRSKEYFKNKTVTPLITILVLFFLGLIFIGPYHFNQQQVEASHTNTANLSSHLNAIRTELSVVTKNRDDLETELEGERRKPLDPGLMTAGEAYGIASHIHETISRFPAVVFAVTFPSDNASFGATLRAILSAACGYGDQHLACNVQQISGPFPHAPDHGIVVHVVENVEGNLLLDALYGSLKGRFFLTKTQDITPPVLSQISYIAGTRVVWFEVGHQSPWRGDSQRTQEGVSQAVIDSLNGWRLNPQGRAAQLGQILENSYNEIERVRKERSTKPPIAAAPGGISPMQTFRVMSEYNQRYESQVIVLLQDLKVQGIDVKDTDSLAQNPQSYVGIGEIGKRLIEYAKQIKKP